MPLLRSLVGARTKNEQCSLIRNMAGNYTPLGYCNETDIENFLLTDIDNSFSSQISDWIAVAENHVNKYLGYTTASGILNESISGELTDGRIDSEGNLVVFPRKIPVNSISALTLVKGTSTISLDLTDGSGNTRYNIPPSNDRFIYPNDELSISGSSVISNFTEIAFIKFFAKLDYIAGYTSVPADIRLATVNIVSDIVMRHSNKEGLESLTQGRITKRWHSRYSQNDTGESDFILDAYKLLNHYRIASRWL